MNENKRFIPIDDGLDFMVRDTITGDDLIDADGVADVLNDYEKENEQLRNNLEDWYQRTILAHNYFNLLEEIIDEVCNSDISNQIWKVYEERERFVE